MQKVVMEGARFRYVNALAAMAVLTAVLVLGVVGVLSATAQAEERSQVQVGMMSGGASLTSPGFVDMKLGIPEGARGVCIWSAGSSRNGVAPAQVQMQTPVEAMAQEYEQEATPYDEPALAVDAAYAAEADYSEPVYEDYQAEYAPIDEYAYEEQAPAPVVEEAAPVEWVEPAVEEAPVAQEQEVAPEPAPEPVVEQSAPVDASVDKEAFVDEWGARIDAYLEGSELEGYGSTFASAAYDYDVDPRFSPAISTIESSKGSACFLPHNAWGWGDSSWDSWDEAIYEHVEGLSIGYGSTLDYDDGERYCPGTDGFWYERCAEEMDNI